MLYVTVRISTEPSHYGHEVDFAEARDLAEWQTECLEEYLMERYPDADLDIRTTDWEDMEVLVGADDALTQQGVEDDIDEWFGSVLARYEEIQTWRVSEAAVE